MEKRNFKDWTYFDFVANTLKNGNRVDLLETRVEILDLLKIVLECKKQPIKDEFIKALFEIVKLIDDKLKNVLR